MSPRRIFEELVEAGLDVVSFHHEAVGDPEPAIAKARAAGLRAGVTLNLETPVEAAFPYLDQIDDLMLMSIRPGWSGQELNPDVYPRIAAARAEVDRRGLPLDIEIDGGVKVDNARASRRRRRDGARLGLGDLSGTRPGGRAARTLASGIARRGGEG